MKQFKVRYNSERDAYELLTRTSERKEFGLEAAYMLTTSSRQAEDEEKEFIHFSILERMNRLIDLGYTMVLN